MAQTPEEIRIRYLYRRLILRGQVPVSLEAAKQLVGPDCAYHLYRAMTGRSGATPAEGPEVDSQDGSGS